MCEVASCRLKNNCYDYLIMLAIISVIFSGDMFGAFSLSRVVGFVYFVYYLFVVKKNKIQVLSFFLYAALFYSLLSALWVTDKHYYVIEFFNLLCYIGVFLLIYYCSLKARRPIDSILKGWLLFAVLNLVVSFWEIYTGEHTSRGQFQADLMSVSIDGTRSYRVYAAVTYGNFNSLSIVLCLCLFMLILYLEYNHKAIYNIFSTILILLIFAVELINTSRGCLLSLVLSVIPLYMVVEKTKYKYFILFLVLLLFCFLWNEYSDMISFLLERKLQARANTGGIFQDPRWLLLDKGFEISKKWLFLGSGAGSMIHEYEMVHAVEYYAHNLWIQALVEYGLFFMLALFWGIAVFSIKCYLSSNSLIHLIGVILIVCWPILTIIDDSYMKSFHWSFFASLFSIYHCSLNMKIR